MVEKNPRETGVDLSQQGIPTSTRGDYDLMGNNPLYIHLAVMKASVNMLI